MTLPKQLINQLNKLSKVRKNVYDKYSKLKIDLTTIDNHINYIKELESIKPQILMNQGRDKKYIYGQVYWYSDEYGSKKKSYRFLIGKMSEKKSKTELKQICMEHFISNVVLNKFE